MGVIFVLLLLLVGALLAFMLVVLKLGIILIIVLCVLSLNGFEAIYLWYCDKPYSEGWFLVGWGVIAFLAYKIFTARSQ